MKKIIVFIVMSFMLSGCSFFNNYIENTVDVSEYKSDVSASMCEVENEKCSGKIRNDYSLFIRIKKDKYVAYMYDSGPYYYSANYVKKERIDQEINQLKRFILWANLSDDVRAKTDLKLDEQSPLILYVSNENIPYLAQTNTETFFTSKTIKYMLLDKDSALKMLKELISIKYSYFNDKNK